MSSRMRYTKGKRKSVCRSRRLRIRKNEILELANDFFDFCDVFFFFFFTSEFA